MNKQWLISRLEASIEYQESVPTTDYHIGKRAGYIGALRLTKKLDEPQKPVVPQFVADYIEYCHSDGNSLWEVFRYINKMPNQVWKWLKVEKHQVTFSKAFGDGYEVEKEPSYCVKIGKGYFSGFDETKVTYVIDDASGALAQRVKYDSKEEAEMDALQIGGTVEEVVEG